MSLENKEGKNEEDRAWFTDESGFSSTVDRGDPSSKVVKGIGLERSDCSALRLGGRGRDCFDLLTSD